MKNSERKAFEEYIKNEYGDNDRIVWFDENPIKALHLMLWNAWQASANREGFVMVPVDTIKETLSWADCASEEWGGDPAKEVWKHVDIIQDAMINESKKMNKDQAKKFIDSIGGIKSAHNKLSVRAKFKPKSEYFAIHPKKPHLIQMYARNEAKLVPSYRFHDLILALSILGESQNEL